MDTPGTPVLGKQRQEKPWDSLAGQPSLISEPKPTGDLVSETKQNQGEQQLRINNPLVSISTHTCTHTHTRTHTQPSWVWRCTLAVPILGELSPEDHEFQASLGYIASPCLKQYQAPPQISPKQNLGICESCNRMRRWVFVQGGPYALCLVLLLRSESPRASAAEGHPAGLRGLWDGDVELVVNHIPCPTVFPNPGPGPSGQGEMVRGTVLL